MKYENPDFADLLYHPDLAGYVDQEYRFKEIVIDGESEICMSMDDIRRLLVAIFQAHADGALHDPAMIERIPLFRQFYEKLALSQYKVRQADTE